MTPDQRVEYIQAIYAACEGTPTSADYDIAAKWADRRIPLAHVLQGISHVKQPKSVRYCQRAVEEEIARVARA